MMTQFPRRRILTRALYCILSNLSNSKDKVSKVVDGTQSVLGKELKKELIPGELRIVHLPWFTVAHVQEM